MKKKGIIGFLIIVLIACVVWACIDRFFGQSHYVSDQVYLKQTYPLLPDKDIDRLDVSSLNFFYYPYPDSIRSLHKTTRSTQPIKINELYCLSWMINCSASPGGSLFRVTYDGHNNQTYPYRDGYPSSALVEVMHYGWYHEIALYYYQSQGSGIYLALGKTLVATNKVDALRKLGQSNREILTLSSHFAAPSSRTNYGTLYQVVKEPSQKKKTPFKKALNEVIDAVIHNANIYLNYIADSSAYDAALYFLCKDHGLDTIQLTTSPNSHGGWAYEIMDCRTSINDSMMERWQQEALAIKQCNPLDLTQCQPCNPELPIHGKLQCRP